MSEIVEQREAVGGESTKSKHHHKFLPTFSSKSVGASVLHQDLTTVELESEESQATTVPEPSVGCIHSPEPFIHLWLYIMVGTMSTSALVAYILVCLSLEAIKFGFYLIPVLVFILPVVAISVWAILGVLNHLATCSKEPTTVHSVIQI